MTATAAAVSRHRNRFSCRERRSQVIVTSAVGLSATVRCKLFKRLLLLFRIVETTKQRVEKWTAIQALQCIVQVLRGLIASHLSITAKRVSLENVTFDNHELKVFVTFVRHVIVYWGVNMPIKPDHALTRLAKMLAGLKERPAGAMIGEAAASDLKDEFRRQNGEAPLLDA